MRALPESHGPFRVRQDDAGSLGRYRLVYMVQGVPSWVHPGPCTPAVPTHAARGVLPHAERAVGLREGDYGAVEDLEQPLQRLRLLD